MGFYAKLDNFEIGKIIIFKELDFNRWSFDYSNSIYLSHIKV